MNHINVLSALGYAGCRARCVWVNGSDVTHFFPDDPLVSTVRILSFVATSRFAKSGIFIEAEVALGSE